MQLLSISFNISIPNLLFAHTDITLEGSCGSCGSCEMASTFCAPPWRQRILSSITAPTGRNSKASETGNSWPNHNNHGEGMWRTPSKNKTWREQILNSFELYKKWTYLMMLDDVRGIWKFKRWTYESRGKIRRHEAKRRSWTPQPYWRWCNGQASGKVNS